MRYLKYYKLFEKISVSDEDVDLIYDKFFKKDVEELLSKGKLRPSMFRKNIDAGTTDLFVSDRCKEAHKINPCIIQINMQGSHYNYKTKIIAFSINHYAIGQLIDHNGDLNDATYYLHKSDKLDFQNSFKEYRIKGTIAHEIAHWLDDTFNNEHLAKFVDKSQKKKTFLKDPNYMIQTKIEIEGQINNIRQLHREYIDLWDNMTFMGMIEYLPSLMFVVKKLNGEKLEKWIKTIKKRMNREGLLGKEMR